MLYTKPKDHRPFDSKTKKILKGFLSYMGPVASWVMWSRPHRQTFFLHPFHAPPTTDPVYSVKNMFEKGLRVMMAMDNRWQWQANEPYQTISYPEGFGELKNMGPVPTK